MFSKCALLLCFLNLSLARSAISNLNSIDDQIGPTQSGRSNGMSSFMNDIKMMYKTYQDCAKSEVSTCLKMKLISSMDGSFRSLKNVEVLNGISFERDESADIKKRPVVSLEQLEATLPRSIDEKDSILNGIIIKEIVSFLNAYTLKIKIPSNEANQRSLSEGRGKKKGGGMIMIPLLLGGTFVPIAYGALALLAGKALIVSKLALVLASIIGIKKLLSGSQNHHESSHEVVVGHGHSGWGRNYDMPHNLAYSEFVPKTVV